MLQGQENVRTQKHSHEPAKQPMLTLTLASRGTRSLSVRTLPYFSTSRAAQSRSVGILVPYHIHDNVPGSEDNAHSVASTSSALSVVAIPSLSSPNNPSAPFLEDISEEYGYSDRAILARQCSSSLLDAIRLGNLAEAERIRERLIESSLPIDPSPEYASVALSILRHLSDPNVSLEGEDAIGLSGKNLSFDLAVAWWDLIPSAQTATRLRDSMVREFCSNLQSPNINIAHARRGALILAAKGYTKDLKAIIPRIVRFSRPAHSRQFIESVNAYDIEHYGAGNNRIWEDRHAALASRSRADAIPILHGTNLEGNTRRRIARRWALAIRTHTLAGRPEKAAQLLLHALKILPKEIGLFTYFICLEGIRSIRGATVKHENYASEIWRRAEENLMSRELRFLNCLLEPSSASPRQQLSRDNSAIRQGKECADRLTFHSLRSLGTANKPLPSTRALAMWINACKAEGRENFMRLLIRRWSRSARLARHSGHREGLLVPHSFANERLFGTAETYLALSEQKPLEVIKAFVAYFSLEGVPGRRLIERIARTTPGISTTAEASRLSPLLGFDVLQGRSSRLTPSPDAIAILLQALLLPLRPHFPRRLRKRLAIDEKAKALELYNDVLAMFMSHAPASEPSGASHSVSLSHEDIPPKLFPDSVTFQAFLSSPHFQTERELAGIIADMRRLDVRPSRNNWTTVIGLLSRNGNEQAVLRILTSIELSQKGLKELMPSPDAVTYVAAIQGALVHGHVALAERVFRRFTTWRATNRSDRGALEKTQEVIDYLEQKLADGKRKINVGLMKWR
jgi:hypothetical protein